MQPLDSTRTEADLEMAANKLTIELAQRIKQYRLGYGLSRVDLAAKTGLGESTLKKFESTGIITLSRFVKLATALNLDPDLESLFWPAPETPHQRGSKARAAESAVPVKRPRRSGQPSAR